MNIIYIHLRVKGSNIYMYRRGRIYKEPHWRNTIIENANTYLISPSNSWWINNTEFGEVKLMMSVSQSLREEICQLDL
jgi:hypothetical protein